MAKYVYPAVFTPENEGGYSVNFPDIENCFTGAETLEEALDMAKDVLCLTLYDREQNKEAIPKASNPTDIKISGKDFTSLISCDTIEYRKFFDSKAVKKTLSIPSWLNDMAERKDINFSATLQNALKEQLGIG